MLRRRSGRLTSSPSLIHLVEQNPAFLAQLGRRATSQALQRLAPERRYPILAAFLRQLVEEITDEVVDLYDRCLSQSYLDASPRHKRGRYKWQRMARFWPSTSMAGRSVPSAVTAALPIHATLPSIGTKGCSFSTVAPTGVGARPEWEGRS